MTQEDKELLLRDLSARLPYGVICTDNRHGDSRIFNIDIEDESVYYTDFDEYGLIENCKPYLRPMSSMTEEENKELGQLLSDDNLLTGDPIRTIALHCSVCTDYFNKKMLDYRGLIYKGLALEAPEGMYDLNKK